VNVFEHAIKLLKKDKKGISIIGQATGSLDGLKAASWGKETFKHNAETFKELIAEVALHTGTHWTVRVELDEGLSVFDGKRTWDDPRTRRLLFEIEKA